MSYIADRFADMLAAHGEAMVLRRTGETDLPLIGKRILVRITDEAVGYSEQTRFRVKIGTTELNASAWVNKAPSPTGDLIVISGRVCSVIDVWPIGDAGEVILYELEIAG
jgi:hypothetical protein